jgi:sialidase-1
MRISRNLRDGASTRARRKPTGGRICQWCAVRVSRFISQVKCAHIGGVGRHRTLARSLIGRHQMTFALLLAASVYPGKAPWRDAVDVFRDGEPVPGIPGLTYGFQIPAVVETASGTLVAFAQANVRETHGYGAGDGRDGWIDIVSRRSIDAGHSWSAALTIVYRNSSHETKEYHACQQPTPVVDGVAKKLLLLSALDNWHQMVQESMDDGVTWSHPRNMDLSLRRPGWGLIFTGLPVGIQLQPPNPRAGRLVLCSSAYWTGGEMVNGTIVKAGDDLSRYAYSMLSDDAGATWRIGGQIQPRHTTECSVAQSFDGDGAVYIYARIWQKNCPGCAGYGRGIAKSVDGGETFDSALLRGLPDKTPDVEGSFASSLVTKVDPVTGRSFNTTCFYVSAPMSKARNNLTMWRSCGPNAPSVWDTPALVDPGSSSYSSVVVRHPAGPGVPKVYDLWAWANGSATPNTCLRARCAGGIRFGEVGFAQDYMSS